MVKVQEVISLDRKSILRVNKPPVSGFINKERHAKAGESYVSKYSGTKTNRN